MGKRSAPLSGGREENNGYDVEQPDGQLAEHRAHLDLQINLLTEQKVTKVLQLVDELRGELG